MKDTKLAAMRILLLIILISFPAVSDAAGIFHHKDTWDLERQLEYKCIAEGRDETWDMLRACVKQKKGTSLITVEKFWEEDPEKRKLKVQ
jgi:hypothetical protein